MSQQEQERLTEKDFALFLGAKMRCQQKGHQYKDFIIDFKNIEYFVNSPFAKSYEVKPILRPLSDIKEQELIDIAKVIYGNPDSVKWRVEFNKYRNCHLVYRKHYNKRFTYCCETGEIECYDMDGVDECKDIYMNQHHVTKYLISKHLDVFGWIEKGLALDSTK